MDDPEYIFSCKQGFCGFIRDFLGFIRDFWGLSPLKVWLEISEVSRFTRRAPLAVTPRPAPMFTHFARYSYVHPLCQVLANCEVDKALLSQEFWASKGASQGSGNLGHKVTIYYLCSSSPLSGGIEKGERESEMLSCERGRPSWLV